uniref:Uncharacterized protein n=1 Tax=Brassica oleracea var. oleracea TaxID=109376 RepID=A0A0D3AWP6_BRAOL
MKAQMDSQQVRLDSLEDLLDVMAVGNPVMQRMLSERRAALGMPPRDPQESDPTRQQPSNPTNYFDNIIRWFPVVSPSAQLRNPQLLLYSQVLNLRRGWSSCRITRNNEYNWKTRNNW